MKIYRNQNKLHFEHNELALFICNKNIDRFLGCCKLNLLKVHLVQSIKNFQNTY